MKLHRLYYLLYISDSLSNEAAVTFIKYIQKRSLNSKVNALLKFCDQTGEKFIIQYKLILHCILLSPYSVGILSTYF